MPSGVERPPARKIDSADGVDVQDRQVARADVAQLARRRIEVEVDERRAEALVEMVGEPVQLAHDLRRLEAVDRVRAQRGAQLAHRRGGLEAAPDDVADDDADAAVGQRETSYQSPQTSVSGLPGR